jgi:hypothetical protein
MMDKSISVNLWETPTINMVVQVILISEESVIVPITLLMEDALLSNGEVQTIRCKMYMAVI